MSELYVKPSTLRNATLQDIAQLLTDERARALDVVAPASTLSCTDGVLHVSGTEVAIDESGVTPTVGRYRMTRVAEEGIAEKLSIPQAYLRRMRETNLPLYDENVNSWLRRSDAKYLVRMLRSGGASEAEADGIVRAFLSDRYRIVDNLDVLLAVLAGVRESGAEVKIEGADLTESRMHVRVSAPGIQAYASELLHGYRSPFTGAEGTDNPVVFAGFVFSNSENGGGAFTIQPRLVVQVCDNGMTITKDALRAVHLGGRLESGVVEWSHDTQQRNLALITGQTRDAVAKFLDADYVKAKVTELEEEAGIRVHEPAETIEYVSKQLAFGEAESKSILEHFILGGQLTAGGVMQAVTSVAQTVEDGDVAAEMEAQAVPAMKLAARRPVLALAGR